jgi:hypothetical protein
MTTTNTPSLSTEQSSTYHCLQRRHKEGSSTAQRRRRKQASYKNKNHPLPPTRTPQTQSMVDICNKLFGFYADPRFTATNNLKHLIETVHPLDMPRRPSNLKIWNLCVDPTKPSKKLLDALDLGLGYGIITKQRDKNPIDIERLRRATRLKFVKFPPTDDDEEYNPKLRATSDWEPPLAPEEIEDALNEFKTTSSDTFRTYRMIPPIFNLDKERIDLLRQVKIHHISNR